MHESGFAKLFSTIVTSTIWQENKETKILWITMLALANRYGEVGAAEPGLANAAGLTLDETLKSLKKLESPDPYSRNQDHKGRRIAKIEGGWQILNYALYRKKMRSRAEYFREYRKRNKNATQITTTQPIAEAEAEVKNKYMSIFDEARKIYQGKKRGLETELANFTKKHKDWKKALPLLKPAIKAQVADRQQKKATNEFVPPWKNFQTWINNRCWEEEPAITSTTAPLQRGSDGRTPGEVFREQLGGVKDAE